MPILAFLALAALFVRLTLAFCALALRIVGVLFFAPLWRRKPKVYKPARRDRYEDEYRRPPPRRRRPAPVYEDEYYDDEPPVRRRRPVGPRPTWKEPVAAAKAPMAAASAAPTRNEQDCVIALVQLGTPKQTAQEITARVSAFLGPNAELNAMIKLALQQIGTAK